jgi:hypothetical protein
MDLPSKERTFEFDHTGESGKKYDGRFTVLCSLNVGQKHSMALEKTRLLGNYTNPTPDLLGFSEVLANLRAKIVEGPNWWKQSNGGHLIDDEDTIVALYKKIEDAEKAWKDELTKKAEEATAQTAQNSQ